MYAGPSIATDVPEHIVDAMWAIGCAPFASEFILHHEIITMELRTAEVSKIKFLDFCAFPDRPYLSNHTGNINISFYHDLENLSIASKQTCMVSELYFFNDIDVNMITDFSRFGDFEAGVVRSEKKINVFMHTPRKQPYV